MMIRLSLDVGFSGIKVATSVNGVINYSKELNAICYLGSDNADAYTGNEKSIVEFNGARYIVGKSALQMPDADIKKVMDYETMKEISPIVAMKYLNRYNLDDIEYVCFTLSSAFLDRSQDYKDYLVECFPKLGADRIRLIPQGAAGKKTIDAIGLDVDDPTNKDSYKDYLILDIGFNTVDVANVIDGALMPNDIIGYEHKGAVLIAEEVQNQIKSKFSLNLSLSRVKGILETGVYKMRGDTYDCTEIIQNATLLYLEVLRDFLEEKYKDRLDAISNVIFIGGGAELIRNNIDVWESYGYKNGYAIIPKVNGSSTYFNCIGGLFF